MPGFGFIGSGNKTYTHPATVGTTPTPAATVYGPHYLLPKYPGEIDSFPEMTDEDNLLSAAYLNFAAMVLEQIEGEIGPNPQGAWDSLKDLLNDLTLNRDNYGAGKIGGIYKGVITGTSVQLRTTNQYFEHGGNDWDYQPFMRSIVFGHMTARTGQNLFSPLAFPRIIKFAPDVGVSHRIYYRCFRRDGALPTETGTFTFQWVAFQMREGGPH